MTSSPRLLIVALATRDLFSPRGDRARAVGGCLTKSWVVDWIVPPHGTTSGAAARRAPRLRRAARIGAETILLDRDELLARRLVGGIDPRRYDAALLVAPPYSAAVRAAVRLARAGIPYVVDVGDPWALTVPSSSTPAGLRRRRAERMLWDHAAAGILTTQPQAARLRVQFPDLRLLVRPNGYDEPQRLPQGLRSDPGRPNTLRLAHFGNIYEPRLDIMDVLWKIKTTGPWAEVELDQFGADWTGHLTRDTPGVRVTMRAARPWPEVVRDAHGYSAALVIGNHSPLQLPSKAVQYLTLPIPRIAVTTGDPEDALAAYVHDKPGWLTLDARESRPGPQVEAHLGRGWSPGEMAAPPGEAWESVAGEIAAFIDDALKGAST